jgi:hypothetical protein
MKESRLVFRNGKAFLKIVFEKFAQKIEPKGSIAVDINMKAIVIGKDDKNYVSIPTRISEIHHYKSLAENLHRKYQKRWKENRNIKRRIISFSYKS